ncbi:ABC transporter permease [Paenibacillus sp. YIM B09110]|uniref:ABC transporter permease n=1 Tax=Paenibacillus sp. YIM B09110 TaxID=3126102 RepID=UPI00301D2258
MNETVGRTLLPIKLTIGQRLKRELIRHGPLYLLALPGVVYLLLFSYLPMSGLVLVFKNYNFKDGIFGSPWAGFDNFKFFYSSIDLAIRSTSNTVMLNILFFVFTTIAAIAIAIMLNEIRSKLVVKLTQSAIFLPFFISWIVIGSVLFAMLDFKNGVINRVLDYVGLQPIDWYSNAYLWIPILVIANVWKGMGYSSIIYLAVITGFDNSVYEAAKIDGASRVQQIFKITIPLLGPTIIMLFLLSVGNMLKGDLSMIMGLTYLNPLLLPVTDIIDVFVYRSAVKTGEFAFASAISLYQSVVGLLLIIGANKLAGWYDRDSKLF